VKKTLLLLYLILPNVVGAFFVNDGVVRENLQTTITTQNDKAEIVIITKLRNDTDSEKVIDYFYPLDVNIQNIHLYLDGNGQEVNVLEGTEKREALFEKAKAHQDHRFFRLERKNMPKLLMLGGVSVPAKDAKIIKLKYTLGLDFLDDVFFKEIFLNDEIFTEEFEITLLLDRPDKIKHFLPIYEKKGQVLDLDQQIIWRTEQLEFIPKQNFKFFFSEVSEPILTYKNEDATYFAHFIDKTKLQSYDKIRIIIDQSGSVYKDAWIKQQEIISFFLDKLSSEKKIKVIFWDDALNDFNEDFVKNSRENQKKIIEYFDQKIPMKKTNFEAIYPFFKEEDQDVLTVFLGDFEEIEVPEVNSPLFFLDFSENNKLKASVESDGGQYLHVFSDSSFIKSSDFLKKLNSLLKKFLSEDIDYKFEDQQEFLPKIYQNYDVDVSDFFVSRSFTEGGLVSNNLASFLPKSWGKRRLNVFVENGLSEEKVLAKKSIMRFFGIGADIKFQGGAPLYFSEKNGWEQYDFFDKANEKNAILIAPFSDAQRQLFITYPNKVSDFFGKGEQVSFCYQDRRCVSVLNKKRVEALVSDLFFWKGYHLDHWANEYLKILADKEILKVSEDGNGLPNQKITRGEFVTMAVEYKYGKDFERVTEPAALLKDLDEGLYLTEVVNFLVEKGIIQGYRDQTFRPHRNLSRAESVKILLSLQEKSLPQEYKIPENSVFPDIDGWEHFWVTTAQKQGMVKGYDDGKFHPNRTLTRAEASKLIVESVK